MQDRHIVIAGATGLVGYAAVRHFAHRGWDVTGLARRTMDIPGVRSISVDLFNPKATRSVAHRLPPVTHLLYAAYVEKPAAIPGWREPSQMGTNAAMFRHALDATSERGALQHVTLIQGTKAYGGPHDWIRTPARERDPRRRYTVFYDLQEDYLRHQQRGAAWSWTILRPQVIFGESLGSHMNMLPALCVYATLLREQGSPLHFPGGATRIREAVDAELLAEACEWAATAPQCRQEIFNITNGDVFEWRDLWPALADAFGMKCGADVPCSLAASAAHWQEPWRRLVRKHQLASPESLDEFVGQGFAYADRQLCYGLVEAPPPRLLSTIKARRAGFDKCVDTEEMFRKWIERFYVNRWIPRPGLSPLSL